MIGRASHMARPSYCPVTELVTSHVLYHSLAQRVKLCKISAISSITKQTLKKKKKGGLGRTWAREHLRLILVLRNKR